MSNSQRPGSGAGIYLTGAALVSATAIIALGNGCSAAQQAVGAACDAAQAATSCADFKPGGDFATATFGISDPKLQASFRALAQLAGDMSSAASGIALDLQKACTNLAIDFAPAGDAGAADGGSVPADLNGACALAVQNINASFAAGGVLNAAGITDPSKLISFDPPKCEVSASVSANCQASCSAQASCTLSADYINANCTPGNLSGECSAQCQGSCEGTVQAAANCQGSCSASCQGSCTAAVNAPVTCQGSCGGNCNGQCTVGGTTTASTGKCAGTCNGKCDATCQISPGANVKCEGTCSGACTGSCKLDATANVQCNAKCTGKCSVAYTAPSCTVTLPPPPSCTASASCKGHCDASAQAKANCRPAQIGLNPALTGAGTVGIAAQAQLTSIKVNLPAIIAAVTGRINTLQTQATQLGAAALDGNLLDGDVTGLVSSPTAAVCGSSVIASFGATAANITASVSAATSVVGAFKVTTTGI